MDTDLIPKPLESDVAADPVAERAQFFFDLELAELTAVIPQAPPPSPLPDRGRAG